MVPLLVAVIATQGLAANGDPEAIPIRDNSFLVEEAYNQEPGVVQHIGTYTRLHDSNVWIYTFTQEWPAPGIKHQLSYTVPLGRPPGLPADTSSGIGDVLFNYRYQWLGGGAERVALSPRVSVILPTGEEGAARGSGSTGLQVNLPLSIEVSRRLVSHSNAGVTYTPSAENELEEEADITQYFLGQSFIWLVHPSFNLMLEAFWSDNEEVIGPDRTSRSSSFFINPGFRAAFTFDSGLQIVPGLAIPIGLGSSDGESGLFFYVSFEHPFRKSP
jgi:hypothetical protein